MNRLRYINTIDAYILVDACTLVVVLTAAVGYFGIVRNARVVGLPGIVQKAGVVGLPGIVQKAGVV
ncbi:hypothetical protein H6H01_00420 [Nostoc calcicola FACHB-3891]|nr:hypothetical protein [Nostoc calcicola FACHB-3891]